MWAAVSVRASFSDATAAAPPHSLCTNSSHARPALQQRSSAQVTEFAQPCEPGAAAKEPHL